MVRTILLVALSVVLPITHAAEITSLSCYKNDWSKARWQQLQSVDFDVQRADPQTERTVDELAAQLRFCLADADPAIRDEVAYMGFTRWLRSDQISAPARQTLFNQLLDDLNTQTNDAENVYLPFAALVLSEVVRVDRISPYLNDSQRHDVVKTVKQYLDTNSDWRGYSDSTGWRHAVAHSADVLLQLTLNPATTSAQIIEISQIVAQHINPTNTHFYHFDEPHRLMRPIVYAMLREDVEQSHWLKWLEQVSAPSPLINWGEAFKSESGLAKRHNTKAFLHALYVTSVSSGNEKLANYKAPIEKAIASL